MGGEREADTRGKRERPVREREAGLAKDRERQAWQGQEAGPAGERGRPGRVKRQVRPVREAGLAGSRGRSGR